jgi:ATP-dependent Clp protease ATP-binding subunit ClpB
LLQVLDDGRLTDGHGRTVDFRNTVLIMTSNLGSNWFFEEWLSPQERRERVLGELRETFRPEFLNRVDEAIVFEPLDKAEISRIVDIQVRHLAERLAARRLEVELTDAARAYLAEAGYDPSFGARPLKRLIQREVQDPLAMKLLAGEIAEGDRVLVDREGDGLVFRTAG